MQKTLTFTIEPDGAVTCEAAGFNGSACEAATKVFEAALGGTIGNKVYKPEYRQVAHAGAATVKAGAS